MDRNTRPSMTPLSTGVKLRVANSTEDTRGHTCSYSSGGRSRITSSSIANIVRVRPSHSSKIQPSEKQFSFQKTKTSKKNYRAVFSSVNRVEFLYWLRLRRRIVNKRTKPHADGGANVSCSLSRASHSCHADRLQSRKHCCGTKSRLISAESQSSE